MFIVKYGCTLTSANKAGTDMEVDAFSDSVGGTTAVTVAEGDIVAELIPGTPTACAFWEVHDGSAWRTFNPGTISFGDLIMAWGGELDYQNGTFFGIAPDGSIFSPNLYVVDDIVQRAINP